MNTPKETNFLLIMTADALAEYLPERLNLFQDFADLQPENYSGILLFLALERSTLCIDALTADGTSRLQLRVELSVNQRSSLHSFFLEATKNAKDLTSAAPYKPGQTRIN